MLGKEVFIPVLAKLWKTLLCSKDTFGYRFKVLNSRWLTLGVTAQTNASEPKLERMLYYEDTKLRSRRRSRKGHVYIHSAKKPLTRAPV